MIQPPGFVDAGRPDHVCRLHRSLYGLKQAPRAWFCRLSQNLVAQGFAGSKTDPSLFIYARGGVFLYLLVYVDDIIVTGNSASHVSQVISALSTDFAVKDLGPLHYFLGIEVTVCPSGLILSQHRYILDLLAKAGLSDSKPVSASLSPKDQLS
ncbi:Retrovirus-related Pol polyprotein from transposon RE1-like protein [Drosera capensis]